MKYCSVITWMNSFVLLLYIQCSISQDSSHPSNKGKLAVQGGECSDRYVALQLSAFVFPNVWCTPPKRLRYPIKILVVQILLECFIPAVDKIGLSLEFNLISILEYVNCQLLHEKTECNMKISCHVGVNPSSALSLQPPSVCKCVCVSVNSYVYNKSSPHVRQNKMKANNSGAG